MDLFKRMLDPNFRPMEYETGVVNGIMETPEDDEEEEGYDTDDDEDLRSTNYADDYRRQELARYAEMGQNAMVEGELSGIATICDLRDEANESKMETRMTVFDKYQFNVTMKKSELLIDSYKDEILSLIKTNMVVIVHGPTGCGKSTQVPQYILDDCRENKQPCNIVVTQPRKIAAISLARRVCEERSWTLGTVCGYQVALERQTGTETVLSYVTTGVLLQKIINAKNLHEYTHIIIDEVHERNQDMDFLLLIIRKFLHLNSINVKVILMSATFDTEKFSHYFRNYYQDIVYRAPTVFIRQQEKRKFDVQEFYAESLSQIGEIPDFLSMKDTPKIHENMFQILIVLLQAFDRMDNKPDDDDDESVEIGNVLIFLPGIYEIEEVYTKLSDPNIQRNSPIKWTIMPLHSSIGLEEQRKVFQPPPPNHRKIILSTNIAESSLTVPDIGYVIDFCLTKALVVDPETQYHSLRLLWASRANCIQRAGRVGRVRDGRVYRMVTKTFYMQYMDESLPPEILRAPLERIILASKMLELSEPPKAILALAIDPPELNNIEYSIRTLKEVGGLLRTCQGVPMKSDGDLTFLGRVMCALPLDVKLSKMIILGHMFSCLQDCIIMAAGCSLANIFTVPFMERLKMYTTKLLWADGSCSDLIAHLHLYKVWSRHKAANVFRNTQAELKWAKQHYVSLRSLREWNYLIKELTERLEQLGIKEEGGPAVVVPSEAYTLLKIIMCGAFYPNYFKRSVGAGQIDEREAVKELSGRDPFRTVYFRNMELGHPGPLYAKRIKEMLDTPLEDLKVSFDSTMKVYVEFLRDIKLERNILIERHARHLSEQLPGKVYTQVYRAVKRRQLRLNHTLCVLSKEQGWRFAEKHNIKPPTANSLCQPSAPTNNLDDQILPTMDIQYVSLLITHIIDAGHFWAQNYNEQTIYIINQIENMLNRNLVLKENTEKFSVGDIAAAKFNNLYYRCRIECLSPSENKVIAKIIFIDYGNAGSVDVSELRLLPPGDLFTKPPQAMECVLCGIKPSHVLNPRGVWTDEATNVIKRAASTNVYAKVYSVVHGIVHLDLYKNAPNIKQEPVSLNQFLIEKRFAEPAEESFLSKENHEKRLAALQSDNCGAYGLDDSENIPMFKPDIDPPEIRICKRKIDLKGPFSPLEMTIYNCIRDKTQRQVGIEATSVNSVLLDVEPQDPHQRLIIAAQINESQNKGVLSLRNTTVMPNIHGLPMLMTLIFCPVMEPKALEDGSRFGQILCGLGTFNNNRPIYPEHDICLTLDTELTLEDIEEVNEVRYWMNTILKHMECKANNMPTQIAMTTMQETLYKSLMKILQKKRKSVEPTVVKGGDIWRKHLYLGKIMQPGDEQNNVEEVWPFHWSMTLNTVDKEKVEIINNIEDLKDMANRTKPMNEINCKLCNMTLYDIQSVRIHLASQEHKKRNEEI